MKQCYQPRKEKNMTRSMLVLLAAVAATTVACTPEQRAQTLPPGTYEKTTKTTDAAGTTTTQKVETEVEVDEEGDKTAVVKTKTTRDPKGLFNKQTVRETEVISDEDRY